MTDAEVSRTLALAWGLAAAPQRGPKRELSLERIVDAAIEIADAEGLAAVTMQRVAKTFEFSTMALYRYVATKDELYQLMVDTAMARHTATLDDTDWQTGLRSLLHSIVSGYRRHPWALDIPLRGDIYLMPGQMRAADLALRAMRTLPASAPTKLAVLVMLSAHARGFAAVEREVLVSVEPGSETRALIEEAVTAARFPDLTPLVRSGVYFGEDPAGWPGDDSAGRVDLPGTSGYADSAGQAAPLSSEEDSEQLLDFSASALLSGLEQVLSELSELSDSTALEAPPAPLTPPEELEAAEVRLREHIELRKRTQQQVRELERRENALRKDRDRVKELAKAYAKHLRTQTDV